MEGLCKFLLNATFKIQCIFANFENKKKKKQWRELREKDSKR